MAFEYSYKRSSDDGILPSGSRRLGERVFRAWKSMDEMPISSDCCIQGLALSDCMSCMQPQPQDVSSPASLPDLCSPCVGSEGMPSHNSDALPDMASLLSPSLAPPRVVSSVPQPLHSPLSSSSSSSSASVFVIPPTSSIPTSPEASLQKDRELQEIDIPAILVDGSLQQQDAIAQVDDTFAMRNFIMHKFLPAAKELAADHENCCAKGYDGVAPSMSGPPQPMPHMKSWPDHIPKSLASSRARRSKQGQKRHQSMRSCGLFCFSLKTTILRIHRTVCTSRNRSHMCHASTNAKFSDAGVVSIKCGEKEDVGLKIKKPGICSDSGTGHAMASAGLHEQEKEIVVEEREQKCVCETRNKIVGDLSVLEFNGVMKRTGSHTRQETSQTKTPVDSPTHEQSITSGWWTPYDALEEDGCQFFDALSRLNSVKSTPDNASLHSFWSLMSHGEVSTYRSEELNDEDSSTDVVSHFDTPRTSTSENKVVKLTNRGTQQDVEHAHGILVKDEQKIGKGILIHENQQPQSELLSEGSSKMKTYPSSHTVNGIHGSKISMVSPLFTTECEHSGMGWPLGMSPNQSTKVGLIPHLEGIGMYANVPAPPLPPSPRTGSWLGNAIAKNASKTSPLAKLQQWDKAMSARKKLDLLVTDMDTDMRWEDIVKGSQIQLGHSSVLEVKAIK